MKEIVKISLITYLLFITSYAQVNNPDLILKRVIDNFNKIEDYEVNVNIKIDVEFIKAPDTEAKIYFKQPDKVKFESETFAMLPREGFDFSPGKFLKKKHTAFYVREDTVDNFRTSIVKVIPLGETDDVILSTLWIDQSKNVIRKVETTTKTNGTFGIELKYDQSNFQYPLPSKLIFLFNIDRTNIPLGISKEITPDSKQKKKDTKPTTTGKVFITYSDYKVNEGIPDEFFEKPKKK